MGAWGSIEHPGECLRVVGRRAPEQIGRRRLCETDGSRIENAFKKAYEYLSPTKADQCTGNYPQA